MGTLVFQANLGGAVNLVGPNTASTVNFTLPSADGSSGQALVTNGSGTLSFSSFVSAAAGSNTQVQFNSSGAFAGSANLTFNGTTLTAANTSVTTSETLSYGTANGVAYLNGSKVVTTGSALTFDGTNLSGTGSIGTTIASKTAQFNAAGGSIYASFADGTTTWRIGAGIQAAGRFDLYDVTNAQTSLSVIPGASGYTAFFQNNAEQMRLTSTGLGIGTSSPSEKLTVNGNIKLGTSGTTWIYGPATTGRSVFSNSDSSTYIIAYGSAYGGSNDAGLTFVAGSTNTMTFNSSGNLGLGVTPSAWSNGKAVEVGTLGSALWGFGSTYLTNNAYYNGGWKYASTAAASYYQQNAGVHYWLNAASGTAGNAITFTQAMTLDASGNLQLGRTSVIGTNNRLAIQMSGTSASSYTAASNAAFAIDAGTATNSVINLVGGGDMGIFHSNSSNAYDVGISFGDNSNRILSFTTANAERARIDSSGNLGIGTTSPNAAAIIDAQSTTKGVRFPNMTTTQKNAISSPPAGLVVFDTTLSKLCVYSGSAWQTITSV